MALGTRGGFSGTLIFLSPRAKDAEGQLVDPHFTVDRKNAAGGFDRDAETISNVSGDLVRLDFKDREYNGNPYEEVVLYFQDDEVTDEGSDVKRTERYRVPLSYNRTNRDLFNRLASLIESRDFSKLKLSYYRNDKGYEAFSLKQRDQRVDWKYALADLPPAIEIKHPRTGKVEKRDYSDVDAFFREQLVAIAEIVNGGRQQSAATSNEQQSAADEAAPAPAPVPIRPRQAAPVAKPAAQRQTAAPAARFASQTQSRQTAPQGQRTATPAPAASANRTAAPQARAQQTAARPAAKPATRPVETVPPDDGNDAATSDVPF